MIDRLMERIDRLENPSVVGLDPTVSMVPPGLKAEMLERWGRTPKAVAEMFLAFNRGVIDAVAELVPAVKPQIAMYEAYGLEGIRAYLETITYAKEKGLLVVGDVKRGDISSTAAAYAAHIDGTWVEGLRLDLWQEDAVTLNAYLGLDGVEPFLEACREWDRGVFILVKTSNPGSGDLQDLILEGGDPVYVRMGKLVEGWGQGVMGSRGYSRVGAVVGATHKEEGERLRTLLPRTFFLVPGYGAQGGAGKDLRGFFDKDGRGCLVNSSRGITGAWKKDGRFPANLRGVAEGAREAALAMKADLRF